MEKMECKTKRKPNIKHGLETEMAIEFIKSTFLSNLSNNLNLYKVVSPIAVLDNTGINDDLNGVEQPVTFPIANIPLRRGVVVHSLAKWKRLRLRDLGIQPNEGIVTDMKALRPDEILSESHSVLVDQWDWEKVIDSKLRTISCLERHVKLIYQSLRQTELEVYRRYPQITPILPPEIKTIHSQELLDMYPEFTPKERENMIAKLYGAVFIKGIGCNLSNGEPHDGRSPDYDDWSSDTPDGYTGLNGDIIVWSPTLQSAMELSSMGIRVDRLELTKQLLARGCMEKASLAFHKELLEGQLPSCIGGGLGQSRLCMFLLRKKHIGEVQVGIWPQRMREVNARKNIKII